jgi:hypothetical protein
MHRRNIPSLLAAAVALLLLVPAGAGADDRSLREAGRSHDAEFARLGKAARAAYRAWDRSGERPRYARRIIRILRRTRREIDAVEAALAAEQPSSDNGATYKRLLTKSLGEFDRGLGFEIGGVRAATAGRTGLARRRFARATRMHRLARRHERQAVAAIEQVLGPG